MIDNFALALSHGLIALAAWRLIHRNDVDHEAPPEQDKQPTGFGHRNSKGGGNA